MNAINTALEKPGCKCRERRVAQDTLVTSILKVLTNDLCSEQNHQKSTKVMPYRLSRAKSQRQLFSTSASKLSNCFLSRWRLESYSGDDTLEYMGPGSNGRCRHVERSWVEGQVTKVLQVAQRVTTEELLHLSTCKWTVVRLRKQDRYL
jgi:hypothetical protein